MGKLDFIPSGPLLALVAVPILTTRCNDNTQKNIWWEMFFFFFLASKCDKYDTSLYQHFRSVVADQLVKLVPIIMENIVNINCIFHCLNQPTFQGFVR